MGGGADQPDIAVFHIRKQGILLSLVESVDLVDKKNGTAAIDFPAFDGNGDLLADIRHRRCDPGKPDKG